MLTECRTKVRADHRLTRDAGRYARSVRLTAAHTQLLYDDLTPAGISESPPASGRRIGRRRSSPPLKSSSPDGRTRRWPLNGLLGAAVPVRCCIDRTSSSSTSHSPGSDAPAPPSVPRLLASQLGRGLCL
jgi:hypothetical protein